MTDEEIKKIINFIQDFECASLKQLQILFDKHKSNFKELLKTGYVNKTGNVFVYKNKTVNMDMIQLLNVLCEYKGRYKNFNKGKGQNELVFMTKDNTVYSVIVTNKGTEDGIVRNLKNLTTVTLQADKFILLFEDDKYFSKIDFNKEYIYCVYKPELRILTKKTVEIEIEDDDTAPDIEAITKDYLMKQQ